MAFKFILFAAFVAVAKAGAIGYATAPGIVTPVVAETNPLAFAAPVAKAVVAEDFDPNPQYSFAYDIQDSLTGDSKSQHETRNGDIVQGSYSLIDADGTKRTVKYTADPTNGFNAIVYREPAAVADKAVATPVAYASLAKVAAPVAYAPIAKVAAAPIAYTQPTYIHH